MQRAFASPPSQVFLGTSKSRDTATLATVQTQQQGEHSRLSVPTSWRPSILSQALDTLITESGLERLHVGSEPVNLEPLAPFHVLLWRTYTAFTLRAVV